jgi:hypothetical protein
VHLFVDYITVNGVRFEAEHYSQVTRDSQPSALWIQREAIYYRGSMEFTDLGLSPKWPAPINPSAPSAPSESPSADLQRIDVRVAGVGGVEKPIYEVWADGVRVGRGQVDSAGGTGVADIPASGFETDSFVFSGSDPHKVAIVFVNDGVDAATGRNLDMAVDYITVNGTRYETEDIGVYTFENRFGAQTRIGQEEMYHNGANTFTLGAPTQEQTLVVRAAGSGSGSSAPEFRVLVDGKVVGAAAISNPAPYYTGGDRSQFRDYSFKFLDDGPNRVQIEYFNDGGSGAEHRDLFIDRISIGGQTHEAEIDGVYSFVRTNGDAATVTGWEGMYNDGVMTFDLF